MVRNPKTSIVEFIRLQHKMLISKQELLSKITNDETFKSALQQMKGDQREKSEEFVKSFVSQFYDALIPPIQKLSEDPEQAAVLRRALVSDPGVVIAEDKSADAQRPEEDPGHG